MRTTRFLFLCCVGWATVLLSGCAKSCHLGMAPTPPAPVEGDTTKKTWGAAATIPGVGEVFNAIHLQAAPGGAALALWNQTVQVENFGFYEIFASVYDPAADQWRGAQNIQKIQGNARQADLAVDGKGNGTALWSLVLGTSTYIYTNHFSAATGAWGAAQRLAGPYDDVPAVKIILSPAGNGMAAWINHCSYSCGGNSFYVEALRYNYPAEHWDASPRQINSNIGKAPEHPTIALDTKGDAFIAWDQNDGRAQAVYNVCYNADTNVWGGDEVISRTQYGDAHYASNMMDGSGNAMAIWSQRVFALDGTPMAGLDARRFDRSKNMWEAATRMDRHISDHGAMYYPNLAVALNNGDFYAAWIYYPGQVFTGAAETRYFSAQKDVWDIGFRVDTSTDTNFPGLGGQVNSVPQIALNPSGDAVLGWTEGNTVMASTKYRYPYGSWIAPLQLNANPASPSAYVAMDAAGNALVLWMESIRGGGSALVSKRFH
jgi:hypothetical protein